MSSPYSSPSPSIQYSARRPHWGSSRVAGGAESSTHSRSLFRQPLIAASELNWCWRSTCAAKRFEYVPVARSASVSRYTSRWACLNGWVISCRSSQSRQATTSAGSRPTGCQSSTSRAAWPPGRRSSVRSSPSANPTGRAVDRPQQAAGEGADQRVVDVALAPGVVRPGAPGQELAVEPLRLRREHLVDVLGGGLELLELVGVVPLDRGGHALDLLAGRVAPGRARTWCRGPR